MARTWLVLAGFWLGLHHRLGAQETLAVSSQEAVRRPAAEQAQPVGVVRDSLRVRDTLPGRAVNLGIRRFGVSLGDSSVWHGLRRARHRASGAIALAC